jgi:hypothetical protein
MTLPPPKVYRRMRKLFAQMGSSGKDAEVARDKLTQLLTEYGLTWNDLPGILAADIDTGDASNAGTGVAAAPPNENDIPDLLGVVLRLI